MLVADSYVGHREDAAVADRLADADVGTVVLSDTDRRRSRVRTTTADGEDIGIVVARDLADGDVLDADDRLVVVELAPVDALVVDVAGADIPPTVALELGHALGNRHWNLALRDGEALFPVPDSRDRMDATVAELLPDGVETRYESVPPTTFDDADDGHAHGGDGHSHGGDGHSHDGAGHSHGVHTIEEGGQ
ncbi:urease accessory protein UreE [Haloarcula sp. S1CR25-12]|uniref:Urease accessory protein UreE n=1 Tax=Haloarcula saliterrae TaxID=2950534 RepID=A0ABU2FEK5_9EURY|nr:urease accessory protein UreE [Haloarcula sp. S1CR25-12]MDS0260684.1 urease accessory protein UreE [Haloarcula sp. S1CR25-12]